MEDFYAAVVQASALKPTSTDVYDSKDMKKLCDTIAGDVDMEASTRCLNALLGVIFLAVCRTQWLETVGRTWQDV